MARFDSRVVRSLWIVAVLAGAAGVAGMGVVRATQVPTTLEDFFVPGTQPVEEGEIFDTLLTSDECAGCHQPGDPEIAIFTPWEGSLMAHAARDPLFWAATAVANQDAADAGDLCIRCHIPMGWIGGRSTPTDGSRITEADRDGISCNFCHRMVDPDYKPGVSPAADQQILADLSSNGLLPSSPGNGSYVLDPQDRRRGPFDVVGDLGFNPHPVETLESPFHSTSEFCATCHDVSNPVYTKQEDGTYALDTLDAAHPTSDKHDMFPVERTYSEWANSAFADGGVDMGGRFGGNKALVSTCQDCHMPDTTARGCSFGSIRDDLPSHEMSGAATWVLQAILNLDEFGVIDPDAIEAGIARSISMLQRAATVELSQTGCYLNVRVINETGHKLPTGYPEGRRIWVNVQLLTEEGLPVAEYGHYDAGSADLTLNTKIYEAHLGVDEDIAAATGVPEGVGFHFALNNVLYKDNRIPPRGFTQAGFAAAGAAPVGADYADQQYWDDSQFFIPPGVTTASVTLFYQASSKEYITFLRDENVTNDAGQVLYNQWVATGKSPPVPMASEALAVTDHPGGDYDGSGSVDLADYAAFPACMYGPNVPVAGACAAFDCDDDGDVDVDDYGTFQLAVQFTP